MKKEREKAGKRGKNDTKRSKVEVDRKRVVNIQGGTYQLGSKNKIYNNVILHHHFVSVLTKDSESFASSSEIGVSVDGNHRENIYTA